MSNLKYSFNSYFIYKIVNSINKKCYVGFHATNNENDDYFGSSKTLNRAIKKYGNENFIKGIIEYVNIENWKERETFWIKKMNAHVSLGGYNLTWGGDGTLGLKFSKVSKQKMSFAAKNRTDEHNEKISLALKGKKLSTTHKIKISESCKNNEKLKEIRRNAFLGKTHTDETKKLIGLKHKGKVLSNETKQKLRDANLGKIMSDEIKLKISKSCKGKIRTEEMKKHYSECKKGVKQPTKNCPYCQKIISYANYSRWHGDNCKNKLY